MTQEENGQLTLFDLDLDIWSGKMVRHVPN